MFLPSSVFSRVSYLCWRRHTLRACSCFSNRTILENYINLPVTHDFDQSMTGLIHQHAACDSQIKIRASYVWSLCRILEYLSDRGTSHQNSIVCAGPGASARDMCDWTAGNYAVNPVSHTMGVGITPSAWSRGISKPEKPTQGAPARRPRETSVLSELKLVGAGQFEST